MQVRSAHNGNSWLRSQRPIPLSTVLALLHPYLATSPPSCSSPLAPFSVFVCAVTKVWLWSWSLYVHPAMTRRRADSGSPSLTSGIRDYRSSYVERSILARSSDARHDRRERINLWLRTDFPRLLFSVNNKPTFSRPSTIRHTSKPGSGFPSTGRVR